MLSVRKFCSLAVNPDEEVVIWYQDNSGIHSYRGTYREMVTCAEEWAYAAVRKFDVDVDGIVNINTIKNVEE